MATELLDTESGKVDSLEKDRNRGDETTSSGILEKEQVTCKFLSVFRAGVPTNTLLRTAKLLGVIIQY